MKAKLVGTFEIEYEVCENLGPLDADPTLALEQTATDGRMLLSKELNLEDWPPPNVKVTSFTPSVFLHDGREVKGLTTTDTSPEPGGEHGESEVELG